MLRFGFLPSDFNPMVLMLGESEDFRALAAVLRGFSRAPAEAAMHELAFCAPAINTRITLLPTHDASGGLHAREGSRSGFAWQLDATSAAAAAALVETLTCADRPAGSVTIEAGDVPLKLSRGEYSEDYLSPPR